ncbi:hypothetical protein BD414DRAFT_577784 [Trametes punicea]|nr:hypothetical protein BD414DRAFT_577784 [Trametes punicea]
MTPMSSLSESQRDSSSDHPPAQPDRPERSRNAKAQARHRAKRKAYIEQLEQTVTKLQSVLALSPDQVAAIPPPLQRIRELEQENEMLHREVEELRRQLELKNGQLRPDIRRDSFATLEEHRADRESKRRRTSDTNGLYMQTHSPPPPLTIPSVASQYPSQSPSHGTGYTYSSRPSSASFYPSYGVSAYPVPETPSSSTTSSPSFSPAEYAPASLQSHDSANRTYSSSYGHPTLPPFSHSTSQYTLVKLEDESHYSQHSSHHTATSSPNQYLSPVQHSHASQQSPVVHWQYSSER